MRRRVNRAIEEMSTRLRISVRSDLHDEDIDGLIATIGAWDAAHTAGQDPAGTSAYWDHWRTALEGLLAELGVAPAADLADRAAALAARPPGHDHAH